MSNSDIEQTGTVKGHIPNGASLSGRISNVVSLSGHISIGSGAGDFIIKMTVTSNDDGNYTVTSCDATVEQIDAAVSAEKRVVVIASVDGAIIELPMLEGTEGTYYFGIFFNGSMILSSVYKVDGNTSKWNFDATQIQAESVGYSNAALPNISTVGGALDELVPKSHAHSNKLVLDKFTETDGKPTYDGKALGSDFIIKMTVTSDDNGNYTVTSCDTTVEQIDAAVANEKRVVVIASIDSTILELPMIECNQGYSYYFGAFLSESVIFSNVYKIENISDWSFAMIQIWSSAVGYSNDALPNVTDVESALNELVPNSHTHSNKGTLDKLSDLNGKLQYNGSDVGLKPVKGTDYWTAADKAEIVADTLDALPTWTGGNY